MKKLSAFLFAIIIMANIQAYAAGIEVLPTFGAKTNAQDRVWVGTFQLDWNDFINKIVFNPIRFREGTAFKFSTFNTTGASFGTVLCVLGSS